MTGADIKKTWREILHARLTLVIAVSTVVSIGFSYFGPVFNYAISTSEAGQQFAKMDSVTSLGDKVDNLGDKVDGIQKEVEGQSVDIEIMKRMQQKQGQEIKEQSRDIKDILRMMIERNQAR